jgi:hypothetical protein
MPTARPEGANTFSMTRSNSSVIQSFSGVPLQKIEHAKMDHLQICFFNQVEIFEGMRKSNLERFRFF